MNLYISLPHGEKTLVDEDIYHRFGHLKWCKNDSQGHVHRLVNGKKVWLHRLINDTPDGLETDHINGNPLDNRRVNLRSVTTQQNVINRSKFSGTKNTKKGVEKWVDKRSGWTRWRARIQTSGKSIFLGYFKTQEDAVSAYEEASITHHGDFRRI